MKEQNQKPSIVYLTLVHNQLDDPLHDSLGKININI